MRFNPNLLEDPLGEVGAGIVLAGTTTLIVRTLGIFQDDRFTYLVSEYQGGKELFEIAASKRSGSHESAVRPIVKNLLRVLVHMHSLGIAHRDISMENTLIFPGGMIKLLDFGQAVNMSRGTSPPQLIRYKGKAGKPYYRSPEMYTGEYLPAPADAFAAGVILFILILGVPPWQTAEVSDSRYQYMKHHGVEGLLRSWHKLEGLSTTLIDLLGHLLEFNPQTRFTAVQALAHAWMNGPEEPWDILSL
jgi:serine/threonine protein kinase